MALLKKRKSICYILLILVLSLCSIGGYYAYRNIDKLHLEKIPFIRPFVLEVEKGMCVPAELCPYPITWDTLDEEPVGFPTEYSWFNFINAYTKLQLKNYMKENKLYIVPKRYYFYTSDDIGELMNILEFGTLEDS